MADELRLSHSSAMILQAIAAGYIYGYNVVEATGLPSGTVYPAVRRLERDGLIRSQWERQSIADAAQRPARKYYKLTRPGDSGAGSLTKALSPTGKTGLAGGAGQMTTWMHGAILRAASLLVPNEQRPRWVKEWRSELWYIPRHQRLVFCMGAFTDALWVLRYNSDRVSRPRLDTPLSCLALMASLAAISILVTAWLQAKLALPPMSGRARI